MKRQRPLSRPFAGSECWHEPMFERDFNVKTFGLCNNPFDKKAGTGPFINPCKKNNMIKIIGERY